MHCVILLLSMKTAMLKGLALTPPVIGRIAIGKVVERNGKRLPEKDDELTLATQVQTKQGWLLHPLDEALRNQHENQKLREIPIRLLFNNPDLNFRAQYSLFDRTSGRPVCVGNGESCKRHTSEGLQSLPCPGPLMCELGRNNQCKPYGRLNVRIGDGDELGTFIFRTTGFNSIRTLMTRLRYFAAVSGNHLATLPLALKLRGKTTTQSFRSTIFYVDIITRDGMRLTDAVAEATLLATQNREAGIDQAALDAAAQEGFTLGAFEDTEDESLSVVEEFYPEAESSHPLIGQATHADAHKVPPLAKLAHKLQQKNRGGAVGRKPWLATMVFCIG